MSIEAGSKPKSEAWLLCAWKYHSYGGCESLEDRSGNDNSPNNLKDELEELLEKERTVKNLLKQKEILIFLLMHLEFIFL